MSIAAPVRGRTQKNAWRWDMIGRRRIISGFACALGATALAQVPGRTYRIAYFGFTAKNSKDDERIVAAFINRLVELGFVEGRNLTIDWRYAEGKSERYAEFAAEMRDKGVDLVVTGTATAARAVVEAGRNIPVVTFGINDPLRTGLIQSLAHPGGQVTGMSNFAGDLAPKRIELFKVAVPTVSRLAFARCPECARRSGLASATIDAAFESYRESARLLGLTLIPLNINAAEDFPEAVARIESERADGVLLSPNEINAKLRAEWVAFEAAKQVPVMADYRAYGCLLSYGPDYAAMFRRVAEIAVQILNGAQPGNLALEQPTKFEFVVNLKVAKAMGLNIPRNALLRADEVIS
ncbi:ABC transporter substrate-binding protein [Variovorax sp. J22R133]|uniref:ABC transporter substrate-binding protein n=1 Tax=Variovorax brevis TaxID=3053503 RepID=UPI0025790607|nr:ABC transporter substrate-binding protein [Variovorax sp. J22R133]MDM0113761.1 ABC transporter substrate-binding protein [Variovorax sp. J22R133]